MAKQKEAKKGVKGIQFFFYFMLQSKQEKLLDHHIINAS
jgi:hypothetical protein